MKKKKKKETQALIYDLSDGLSSDVKLFFDDASVFSYA